MTCVACFSGDRANDFTPDRDGVIAKLAMVSCGEMFAVEKEKIGDLAMS
ncbi:hypothetical protein RHAB21_04587 [Pseudorhizobium halotolerans]|uniref:Uncharacterized protein n=1 Tax=Pseudorhizobium halotolerans TaxID=1233081 RepID=A0ABM8PXN5_9HYPH|nr:hypothetical protein RHAB21_04587 [Pseudorhizobium halotolerans]